LGFAASSSLAQRSAETQTRCDLRHRDLAAQILVSSFGDRRHRRDLFRVIYYDHGMELKMKISHYSVLAVLGAAAFATMLSGKRTYR
jgi:hypothetical protein